MTVEEGRLEIGLVVTELLGRFSHEVVVKRAGRVLDWNEAAAKAPPTIATVTVPIKKTAEAGFNGHRIRVFTFYLFRQLFPQGVSFPWIQVRINRLQ
jgi:hypothetical protein